MIQKKLKRSRVDRTSQNSKGPELPPGCVRPILSYRAALEEQGFGPTAERFGIIPESSDPENASVPNVYDPEVMQSILCEMFVNSSAEYHDTSNDGLSDSELNIIFFQAVNMSVLYNQVRSLCTNPRLSSKLLYLMPCSLLLFSNSTFLEATEIGFYKPVKWKLQHLPPPPTITPNIIWAIVSVDITKCM